MGMINLFDSFGADAGCLLVACVVVATVNFLKNTLLKNYAQSPLITLLPFILGVVLYAGYYGVLKFTMNSVLVTIDGILQQGFTAGCFATVISAFLDKCFGKTTLSGRAMVVRKLLEGFVEEKKLDSVAKQVANVLPDALTDVNALEGVSKVAAVLTQYQTGRTDEMACSAEEMEVLAKLIVATLQRTA